MASTRRLAAILAADVAGYSRLMGADEEGTLQRLKAYLGELVEPKIREHRGRIVKTTGDGLLAEFASIVDAVRGAGEIQRAMADRDLNLAEERRLRFRIGVNLGDVLCAEVCSHDFPRLLRDSRCDRWFESLSRRRRGGEAGAKHGPCRME